MSARRLSLSSFLPTSPKSSSQFHQAISDIIDSYTDNIHALRIAVEYLRSQLESGHIIDEYRLLENAQRELNTKYSCTVATSVPHLNRYCDVLPYDHSRVVLRGYDGSSNGGSSNGDNSNTNTILHESYINASTINHITHHNTTSNTTSTTAPRHTSVQYIAAQGPLPKTLDAFWSMIIQQKVESIVMLTGFVENQRKKCEVYFPDRQQSSMSFKNGTIVVNNVKTENAAQGIVRRTFEITVTTTGDTNNTNNNKHLVQHYHFTSWPDHGVPSSPETFLILCSLIRKQQQLFREYSSISSMSPVVVHCSAGIGRSGVFCTVDIALRHLLSLSNNTNSANSINKRDICDALDIKSIVYMLREHRCGMVQTQQQYEFCYRAVLLAVERAIAFIEKKGGDRGL